METTNSIKHVIDVNNKKHNYKINIRLNDECRNGHEDFAITADFWLPNNTRTDQNLIAGGCCRRMFFESLLKTLCLRNNSFLYLFNFVKKST